MIARTANHLLPTTYYLLLSVCLLPSTALAIDCCLGGLCQKPATSSITPSPPHPAVVRITVTERDAIAGGTGTLVSAGGDVGVVVTSAHVVRQAAGPIVVYWPGGARSGARLLKTDAVADLAALLVWRPGSTSPVAIAAAAARPGELLSMAGYGSGDYRRQTGRAVKYVAATRDGPNDVLEVSAATRSGDSGGPVFNARGELAGVLFGCRAGASYATDSARVAAFLAGVRGQGSGVRGNRTQAQPEEQAGGPVESPYVGARGHPLPPEKRVGGQHESPYNVTDDPHGTLGGRYPSGQTPIGPSPDPGTGLLAGPVAPAWAPPAQYQQSYQKQNAPKAVEPAWTGQSPWTARASTPTSPTTGGQGLSTVAANGPPGMTRPSAAGAGARGVRDALGQLAGQMLLQQWLTGGLLTLAGGGPLAVGGVLAARGLWRVYRRRKARRPKGSATVTVSDELARADSKWKAEASQRMRRFEQAMRGPVPDAPLPRPLPPKRPTQPQPPAQEGPAVDFPKNPERDTTEARQFLRLAKLEGRDPVHDALIGTFVMDDLAAIIEGGGQHAAFAAELKRTLEGRFNDMVPLKRTPKITEDQEHDR